MSSMVQCRPRRFRLNSGGFQCTDGLRRSHAETMHATFMGSYHMWMFHAFAADVKQILIKIPVLPALQWLKNERLHEFSSISPRYESCGLPRYIGGSAPTSFLSGPARGSLALRPARSPGRLATCCLGGFGGFVTSAAAPIASGWSAELAGWTRTGLGSYSNSTPPANSMGIIGRSCFGTPLHAMTRRACVDRPREMIWNPARRAGMVSPVSA